MMKNNWGTYIAVVYTIFAASMIFMLLRSCGISSPLIENNYYNKELQFKAFKKFSQEAKNQGLIPKLQEDNEFLIWQFDSMASPEMSGTIVYKHLSEPNYDKETPYNLNPKNQIRESKTAFNKGLYQMEMFWSLGADTFYYQTEVEI